MEGLMFKLITTLLRGRTYDAAEAFVDTNTISILRQQLRDAADGLTSAKKSVAIVMAYAAREKKREEEQAEQLADLEARAMEAIRLGREDLASEAAAVIADLEKEHAATKKALGHYQAQAAKLRDQVALSEQRLRTLQRGKQIADAAQQTQKLRGSVPNGVLASLRDAEETLERLQERQSHAEQVEIAMVDLNATASATHVVEKLAGAGCGRSVTTNASRVLRRLQARAEEQSS
ncbi:PspA/IM30 family protein [Roseibium denhamense]|nr:PspA/IM30 family protein [Roseibium denhamense]